MQIATAVQPKGDYSVKQTLSFILLCGLILALAACSLGTTDEATCDEGGALFFDSFDGQQDCGWQTYNQRGAIAELEPDAGVLQMTTSQPGEIWWTNPGRDFNDVIITTQATQISGPDDNAYGVICRYQDEANFYIFLISGDGYYAIGKYQTGSPQIIYLTEGGEYVFSDVINQGAATNQIRATCQGNQLSLAVNGIPLATVSDPTFVRGDVGTAISTLQPGTSVIQFDDFQVLAP